MRTKNIKARSVADKNEPSSFKKNVHWTITLILPFFILILIESALRIFNYGDREELFISIPDKNSKYFGINLKVANRYFSNLSTIPTPRKDLFLKEKPKNGYRIFVLGESSAAGFPYGNNLTFPRILNRRLSDVFPDKHVEIVNTSMTAINSYTQLDFMDEILQHQPDAILIYSGHNEFYGALGVGSMESFGKQRWMVKTTLFLQKFRVYVLMQNLIAALEKMFGVNSGDVLSDPSATLMERIVKNKTIPFKSDEYELGINQFKENIREIIQSAKNAGVKIIISELVSNIGDNKPFKSVETKNFPPAQKIYDLAVKLKNSGKFEEAKKAFYFAKDLDVLRFRASEDLNIIIHELADEHKVPVVPMKAYFESNSPNQIIGNNLMHEHLHPNFDGYFLMADAFFNTMRKENFIKNDWPKEKIKPSVYYAKNWGYTELDSMYAFLAVKQLKGGWPFKKEKAPNRALVNFKPATKVDSVAFNISLRKLTLEQGHIMLAEYYKKNMELEKAFKEYNSLIYTVPYLDLFYQPAVEILIIMQEYNKALNILHESLKYNESLFAYKWIGQIYLIKNETLKGISFLEKARNIESRDFVLLYNLGRAYFKVGQLKRGDEILNQLKAESNDYSLISRLEEYRKASY
jgi:tetratricopeptide (TPR) repeat protein